MKREFVVLLAVGLGMSACVAEVGDEAEETSTVEAALASCNEFVLSSPAFDDGDALPYEHTCEGQSFASGFSPELRWSKGPKGTKGYAVVLKDLSLVEAAPDFAYHWAAWDLKQSVRSVPEALESVQFPKALKGGQQLSAFPDPLHAYFGPCPSWQNLCSGGTVPRSNDSYAFVVYALDVASVEVPEPDPNISNYVRQLDTYFESIALDKAELTFTSDARPSSFSQVCPEAG
jgi:phosphatidylethanolamine-binding protein (PEBP) family uncharacterized protein